MTTILTRGGHFVGEPLKKGATPQQKRAPLPVDEYEDFAHLEAELSREQRDEAARNDKHNTLRAYIKFWAAGAGERSKRNELAFHRTLNCWSPCEQCSNCRCGEPITGGWSRCLCASGRKQLSPYRIAWRNNAEKAFTQSNVWEVGVGWVPRVSEKYEQRAVGLDL